MAGPQLDCKSGITAVEPAGQEAGWASLVMLLLVWAVSTLFFGCTTTLSYQPNDQLVQTLGTPQAQQRFKEVLLRSVNPKIDAVEITDDFLRYHLSGTTYEVRIFFKDVDRVDVYSNHLVLVRGRDNPMLARPLFGNVEDAKMFADFLLSFRAHQVRGGAR
jgi:hypothetical protein